MNLCQDCITVKPIIDKAPSSIESPAKDDLDRDLVYQGTSLDEFCLLNMTRDVCDLGYFIERDSETIKIRLPGEDNVVGYKLLKYNEFDSKRKCASIVVKAPNGKVLAYVKGSDSTLLNMLDESKNAKG